MENVTTNAYYISIQFENEDEFKKLVALRMPEGYIEADTIYALHVRIGEKEKSFTYEELEKLVSE